MGNERAGLELDGELTVHAFRKSCGQNCANHLPVNMVKERMGHADISTTTELCGAVGEEHDVQVQWPVEALLRGHSENKY